MDKPNGPFRNGKQTDQFQESAYHNRLADLDQLEALSNNQTKGGGYVVIFVLAVMVLVATLYLLSQGAN